MHMKKYTHFNIHIITSTNQTKHYHRPLKFVSHILPWPQATTDLFSVSIDYFRLFQNFI